MCDQAYMPNLREIGQKLLSLSWTIGISDRHTDTQTDIHSSDYNLSNAMHCIAQTIMSGYSTGEILYKKSYKHN